jgi:hypothetical protein
MFNLRYKGLRLIPSKTASKEMLKYGLMIRDCKKLLENGYDAPRRRAKDTEEKWLNKGNKTHNVVVVKSFNYLYNEDVWLITHIGKFTRMNLGG